MPSPKTPGTTLITAEEIHTFIRRARAELTEVYAAGPFAMVENQELREREGDASRLLAFCAEAAGWTRSPSLLPFLVSMFGEGEDNEDVDERIDKEAYHYVEQDRHRWYFGSSVARILEAAPAPLDALVKLAASTDEDVRYVAAEHLPLDQEAGVRLLETLATTDDCDLVRKIARKRLAAVRDIAWWQGKFSRDPLSGLSQADAERLRGPLETIAEVLEMSQLDRHGHLEELAEAIAELPDAPALDVLRTVLSNTSDATALEPGLFAQLITRDQDGSVLVAVVEHWTGHMEKRHRLFDEVAKARPLAEAPARRAAARRFFDEARRRSEQDPADPVAEVAVTVMAALWPAEDDPTPVLSAMLAQHERCGESPDELSSAYWKLLARADLDVTPLLPRLAEALVLGFPPPWHDAPGWWESLLHRAPTLPEARDLAARVIAESTDPNALAWALRQQIGRTHDPASDPAPAEILRRAWGRPPLRAAILAGDSLIRCALPFAREDLRAGRLTYTEAGAVLEAIDALWAGLAPLRYSSSFTPEREQRARETHRRVYQEFLGPEALHEPPTEAEWAIFRALRDQALPSIRDSRDWLRTIRVLPAGEWTAADRAAVLCAMEAIRTEHSNLAYTLAAILITHPDEAWLPLLEELAEIDPEETATLHAWRDRMRETLDAHAAPKSAEPPAHPETPGRPTPSVEWMDEPEDDP